ncbi:MAG: hypothetical protein JG759_554 [Thermoanaerobacter sp.]|jgi:hypothetical protein|nr:hypothetical protein [Thermoanaerobacter sp.]
MNLYDILEVSPKASDEVIKNAYRALAKKYHPDLCPDNESRRLFEEKMKLINYAFEILSDKNKRAEYDKILENEKVNESYYSSETENSYDYYNENVNFEEDNFNHKTDQGIYSDTIDEYVLILNIAKKRIFYGMLWLLGGLILTYATYASSHDGKYFIFRGAIVWGIISLIRGVWAWLKVKLRGINIKTRLKSSDFIITAVSLIIIVIGIVIILRVALYNSSSNSKSSIITDTDTNTISNINTDSNIDSNTDSQQAVISEKGAGFKQKRHGTELYNYFNSKFNYIDLTTQIKDDEMLVGFCTINSLNIRENPNTSANIITEISPNDLLIVFGETNGWYYVFVDTKEYKGEGWTSSKYVDLTVVNTITNKYNLIRKAADNSSTTPSTSPRTNSQEATNTNPVINSQQVQQPTMTTFITLGSTESDVKRIMGSPSSIIGDTWSYGLSNIYFENGKVNGWSIIDKQLKVSLGGKVQGASPIMLGSSITDVINAMGTPTSIIGNTWSYGLSNIYFENGKVSGWSIIDRKLNVFMGNKKDNATPFSKGSNMQDVINAMGTPTSIIGNTWGYGLSSVYFDNDGIVTGWSVIDNQLKVR